VGTCAQGHGGQVCHRRSGVGERVCSASSSCTAQRPAQVQAPPPAAGTVLTRSEALDCPSLVALSANPAVCAAMAEDVPSVVCSARAVEAVLTGSGRLAAGMLGECLVVARADEVGLLSSTEPLALDDAVRGHLRSMWRVLIGEGEEPLVGAVFRSVGPDRVLTLGVVDSLSSRTTPVLEPDAKDPARLSAHVSRVPSGLWRVVVSVPHGPLTPADSALVHARANALGLARTEVCQVRDTTVARCFVQTSPPGSEDVSAFLVPCLEQIRALLATAGGRVLVFVPGQKDQPSPDEYPVVPATAMLSAAMQSALVARRAPKRPRDGEFDSAVLHSALEERIVANIPKTHKTGEERRSLAARRVRPALPVVSRIADPGPWQGLSCDQHADPPDDERVVRLVKEDVHWAESTSAVSLAIIVPFRDQPAQNRARQLEIFARDMTEWITANCSALVRWHIIVVEQTDDGYKFNRGMLLNVGFDLASKDAGPNGKPFGGGSAPFNVAIMHDVDLVPADPRFAELYCTPPRGPVPIARAWLRYDYPNYLGGITAFPFPLFRKINGYPNNFWGWGGEDDDLRRRLEALGHPQPTWQQPPVHLRGRIRDLEEECILSHGGKRASVKLKEGGTAETLNLVRTELLQRTHTTWWKNGLSSLEYRVVGHRAINPSVTVVTVDLLAASKPDSVKLTDIPFWAASAASRSKEIGR
jgi:hypothetical protein